MNKEDYEKIIDCAQSDRRIRLDKERVEIQERNELAREQLKQLVPPCYHPLVDGMVLTHSSLKKNSDHRKEMITILTDVDLSPIQVDFVVGVGVESWEVEMAYDHWDAFKTCHNIEDAVLVAATQFEVKTRRDEIAKEQHSKMMEDYERSKRPISRKLVDWLLGK